MKKGIVRTLCLGGGGSLGAFIAAVVYTLLGNGSLDLSLYFVSIVGTSTGGLGSAMIARCGVTAYFQLWIKLVTNKIYEAKDIISFLPVNAFFDAAFGTWCGLMNDQPLESLIDQLILITDFPKVDYTVCFVDMNSGHTFYATEHTNGNFSLEDYQRNVTYIYDRSWFPNMKKCILATASTEGGVNSVPINLAGGIISGTVLPTPNITIQGADGGPSRLVPVDYALRHNPRECVIISLTNPIEPYTGAENIEGTALQSINIALNAQWDLAMQLADKYQSDTCNVVRYQISKDSESVNVEQFDPKVSAKLEADGQIAQPVSGSFLTQ